MAERKPTCIVQSATPGRATIRETEEELRRQRAEHVGRISMPAQDHISNCYDVAIAALLRLQQIETACASVGHPWRYSPFVKLSSPPMRERVCLTCRRLELLYDTEVPPIAIVVDEDTWAKLVHGERQWASGPEA